MPTSTIEHRPIPNIYRPEPPRRRFEPLRLLGRLLGLFLLLALAAFGYVYVSNTAFRQTMASVVVGANPKAAFGRDAITLLIVGKDEDRDNRDRVMKTNGRSDTIILSRLDFNSHRIDLLSIPRDTRVRIPGTRGYRKINAAHSIGGWEKTSETLHELLGVTPDSVVVVDYDMLRQVIDDLGGVTVNVDKQLDYDDNWGNLHIHLKPGVQTLTGTEAMGFVRFRHANKGSGDSDFVRIQRQQALLQALKDKLKEPATWVRVPRVLETVRRQMDGTLSYSQLVALASFARSVSKQNISSHVLPSRPGRVYVYPNREEARALVARLFPTSDASKIGADAREEERPRTRRTRRTRRSVQAEAPVAPASAMESESAESTTPEDSEEAAAAPDPGTVDAVEPAPEPLIDASAALDTSPSEPAAPVMPAVPVPEPALEDAGSGSSPGAGHGTGAM